MDEEHVRLPVGVAAHDVGGLGVESRQRGELAVLPAVFVLAALVLLWRSEAASASPKAPVSPAAKPKHREQETADDREEDTSEHEPSTPAGAQIDKRPVKFLKGKLATVDCTQAPAAVLTVITGRGTLRLRSEDYKSITLIGTDDFSCDWRNRAVAVNYKAGGKLDGDVVSLEIQ